jgi:hypothetical protein
VRLAAGRARAQGLPTRGTTAPQRLRRVDRWLAGTQRPLLRRSELVVDLGFGSSPVTTLEMAARLRRVNPALAVVGLEIDRDRVAAATAGESTGDKGGTGAGVRFAHGGFELAGLAPQVVRAMNVLRQYEEGAVAPAWAAMTARGAHVVDGTCDEVGRRAAWVWVGPGGPLSLTLATHLGSLGRPSQLAERLPKALIHRNVPGQPVHTLLSALDAAWDRAAPLATYGPRQRWIASCQSLAADWPVVGTAARWGLGEVTVSWSALSGWDM